MSIEEIDCSRSEAVSRLAYDHTTRSLYILYVTVDRNGDHFTYRYDNVNPILFNKLNSPSSSIGKILAEVRRNHRRVTKLQDFPIIITNKNISIPEAAGEFTNSNNNGKYDYTSDWLNAMKRVDDIVYLGLILDFTLDDLV